MKQSYERGETCFIYIGEVTGKGAPALTACTVVDRLTYPWFPYPLYVLRIDDPDFMHMELRDVSTMSPARDEKPAFAQLRTPRNIHTRFSTGHH